MRDLRLARTHDHFFVDCKDCVRQDRGDKVRDLTLLVSAVSSQVCDSGSLQISHLDTSVRQDKVRDLTLLVSAVSSQGISTDLTSRHQCQTGQGEGPNSSSVSCVKSSL